jgi:hypothetical protein
MKPLLIIAGLAVLLACFALLRWRRDKLAAEPVALLVEDGSFVVQVKRPVFGGRPPWEIPRAIMGGGDENLRFDQTSPGAQLGNVGPNRLELRADGGWDLSIVTDSEGQVAPGTRLIFPVALGGGRPVKFNCWPANAAAGRFNTTARPGSDRLDGDFFLELRQCKNAVSGKNTAGQPVFTVRGSFKGLPQTSRHSRW